MFLSLARSISQYCDEGMELFSVYRATVHPSNAVLLATVKTVNMFGFNVAQIIFNFLYHFHMLR